MTMLREFIGSSSGLAPARQGLGLGWVISALAGVAVLLSPREVAACDDIAWTEGPKSSSGCKEATGGEQECKCRDCWLDTNCSVNCGHWYCCDC